MKKYVRFYDGEIAVLDEEGTASSLTRHLEDDMGPVAWPSYDVKEWLEQSENGERTHTGQPFLRYASEQEALEQMLTGWEGEQ